MSEHTPETLEQVVAYYLGKRPGALRRAAAYQWAYAAARKGWKAAERRAGALERPAPCLWRPQQDPDSWDYWEAACGGAFSFEDGDPDANECAYCPRCGHPILLVARTESIDVEDEPEIVAAREGGET